MLLRRLVFLVSTLVMMLGLVWVCPPASAGGQSAGNSTEQSADNGTQDLTGQELRRKIDEALNATGEYLGDKGDTARESVKEQLQALDKTLSKTLDKASELGAEAREKYSEQLEALQQKSRELGDKIESLGKEGGLTLDSLLKDFQRALNGTQEKLQQPEDNSDQVTL